MSRMWRVQRELLPTNSGGGIIGTNACASRATRAATRSPILLTALASKEFRSMVRRSAATQTWPGTAPDGRRLGAFGVQPGRRSGTRPHGEWTEDRIDAWLIARDIDRDHVTETTAKAWSAAGKLVVQHRQALEGWPCTWSMPAR
jgi:hypothetical protein